MPTGDYTLSNVKRRGLHRHKSSDTLGIPTGQAPFELSDHIGELRRLNTVGSGKPISTTKPGITGTMKKWGSWYFKENGSEKPSRQSKQTLSSTTSSSQNGPRRQSAPTTSENGPQESECSIDDKPANAPAPHKFPSEFLSSIGDKASEPKSKTMRRSSSIKSIASYKSTSTISDDSASISSKRKVKGSKSFYNLLGGSSSKEARKKNDEQTDAISDFAELPTLQYRKNSASNSYSSENRDSFMHSNSTSKSASIDSSNGSTRRLSEKSSNGSLQAQSLKKTPSHHTTSFGSFEPPASFMRNDLSSANSFNDPPLFSAPSLDEIPSELIQGNQKPPADAIAEPFQVPMLAIPPPMRERTISKRGSNDNIRSSRLHAKRSFSGKSDHFSGPSMSSNDLLGDSSGIAVPDLVPAATAHTYEQGLTAFLQETSAKFESSQLLDNTSFDQYKRRDGDGIGGGRRDFSQESLSKSIRVPSGEHLQQTQSQQQPQPQQQPILSYRKVKPKNSQGTGGFKFF